MDLLAFLHQLSHWFPPSLTPSTVGLWLVGLMLMQYLAHRLDR